MPPKKRKASGTDASTSAPPKRQAKGKKAKPKPVEDEDEDSSPPQPAPKMKKEEFKNQQVAKSTSVEVPLDEPAVGMLGPSYHVYIDDATGMIYDATLNQTNIGGDSNNNKFYRIQVLQSGNDFKTWNRWGRVGGRGQTKVSSFGDPAGAIREFEKKFREKSSLTWENRLADPVKGKYTFLEKNYDSGSGEDGDDNNEDVAEQSRRSSKASIGSGISTKSVESKLSEPVQRLMSLIFNQGNFNQALSSMDYDATKMPLGKLSKRTLQQGFTALKDLADLVRDPSISVSRFGAPFNTAVTDLSSRYWTLIPHAFGMRRPLLINNTDIIKKEVDLLDSLTDMQAANEIMKKAEKKQKEAERMNQLDRQFAGLGLDEMTPLESSSGEFQGISEYLSKSAGSTHHIKYHLQDVFRIERQGEAARFTKSPKNSDRRLLWHGSRATNYGGILSQGLRIAPPEAPVTGYMFGKGVYLADMSTKSANYCYASMSQNTGLLLLCEAELGKPMLKLTNADSNAGERAAKEGHLATWGVGGTAPKAWKDAGCLHENLEGVSMPDCVTVAPGQTDGEYRSLLYNEYIVYDIKQIRLRYLLRVNMTHG